MLASALVVEALQSFHIMDNRALSNPLRLSTRVSLRDSLTSFSALTGSSANASLPYISHLTSIASISCPRFSTRNYDLVGLPTLVKGAKGASGNGATQRTYQGSEI